MVATLGTYEKDGQKKYISRNVGTLGYKDGGVPYIKLDATFNPAGCVRKDDGSVWLSAFEKKKDDAAKPVKAAVANNPFDDEIPF